MGLAELGFSIQYATSLVDPLPNGSNNQLTVGKITNILKGLNPFDAGHRTLLGFKKTMASVVKIRPRCLSTT